MTGAELARIRIAQALLIVVMGGVAISFAWVIGFLQGATS